MPQPLQASGRIGFADAERDLPDALASTVEDPRAAKLHAPAAVRNAAVLTEFLASVAPETGFALEIASGTGQHVIACAAGMSGLTWQSAEIDPARRP